MIRSLTTGWRGRARLWLALALVCGVASQVEAANLKVEAKLIWGANEEKSPNPAHKPVQKELAEKLRKVFKWKYYFEVNRQVKTVPSRGSNRFELSDKCAIEIRELEGPVVVVKLVGDGKEVNKTTKPLRKGEWFAYAGDDKNDCAWFVIISELDENAAK
jgi:hypothetical protein